MRRLLLASAVALLCRCHDSQPPAKPPAASPTTKPAPQDKGPAVSGEDPAYLLDLADLYLKYKKYDEAQRIYFEIQKTSKDPETVGRAMYGVALVHIMKGEHKLAIGPLISAIQTAPPSGRAELKFMLVGLYVDTGDEAAAERVLDEMLREPDHEMQVRNQIYNRLAELYVRRNDLKGLAAKLEKMSEADPKNREILTVLAQLYSGRLQDFARALAVCEKLLTMSHDDPAALQAVMESAARAGKPDRALEVMEKLLKTVEKDVAAQIRVMKLLGGHLLQAKAWEKAAAVLDRAEKLCPTPAEKDDVRMGLYTALKELPGRLPERVKELEKAAEDPKDESALRGLLLIHQRFTGATAKADEVLAKLLALKPEDPAYLSAGVDIARQKGDHERVAALFEKLLDVDVRSAGNLLETYVNALKLAGKMERALPLLLKAAERDAALRVAFLAQSGELMLRAGQREAAVKLWERMRSAVRESKKAADYLAAVVVLKRAGAFQEAMELCQEALKLGADAATLANLLLEGADLLDLLKKPEEAEKLCREILRRTEFSDEARRAAQKKLAELQQRPRK
ncbi:MAG: tetratricopeptide repeat protein [Planctomycetes bacterium]|nr:tetratricopeptide repeat protein [Planctomycetota bacterium]